MANKSIKSNIELPLGDKSEMTYLELFEQGNNKVEFTLDMAEIQNRNTAVKDQFGNQISAPADINEMLRNELLSNQKPFQLYIDAAVNRAYRNAFQSLPNLTDNEKSELILLSLLPVFYRTTLDSIKNFLRKSYKDYNLYQATQNGISVPFHQFFKENKRALQTIFDEETQTWKSKPNLSEEQIALCKLVATYENAYFKSLLDETSMAENSSHLNPIKFAEALLPSEVEMRNTIIKLLEDRVETHLQHHLPIEAAVTRLTTARHVKNLLIASGYFYDGQFQSPLENIIVNASFERGIDIKAALLKYFQLNRNKR